MRSLVALCLVLGCSADLLSHVGIPAGVQSVVADGDDTVPADVTSRHLGFPTGVHSRVAYGDDTVPADVTRLSVFELTGVPLPYLHGVPSFSFPAALSVKTEEDSDEITTTVHDIPYTFPSLAAALPAFSVPASVPVNTEVDSDEITTAVHGIPNTFQSFAAVPFPAVAQTHNNFPYNNFGYNNFGYSFYNHHNPLTYSSAGYPYHFGFPYNFGYNWAPTTYAAAAPVEVEDSSFEEDD